jgi:hydrogenase-4 component F
MPPFPIFLSEFLLVRAMFANGAYPLAAVFFLLVTIIVYGMGNTVMRMTFGAGESAVRPRRPAVLAWAPQVIFLIILFILGIGLGSFNFDLIDKAASFF